MPEVPEEYFPIIIWGTIILSLFIIVIIVFLMQYQKKHRIYLEQKNKFTQTLLQSQLEIQEQTLKNISQEIHDNIGQVLSLAKLNLFTMNPDQPELLSQKIKDSRELVSKAIVDLRDLSHSMNTDFIEEMGLLRSIEYELEMLMKTGELKTNLVVTGTVIRFDKQKELIIFRIVQEVINNIIKHAKAGRIDISAGYTDHGLKLEIRDDGQGMNLQAMNNGNGSGLGLKNMNNRASLIGAAFNLESTPGNGTSITIVLPKENSPT